MSNSKNETLEFLEKESEIYDNLTLSEKDSYLECMSARMSNINLDMLTIMEYIGKRAKERGLTPEILEQILKEENP